MLGFFLNVCFVFIEGSGGPHLSCGVPLDARKVSWGHFSVPLEEGLKAPGPDKSWILSQDSLEAKEHEESINDQIGCG